ncbi:MAG: hypothetical protein RLY14_2989, partial [Planctomycetota bacterium]
STSTAALSTSTAALSMGTAALSMSTAAHGLGLDGVPQLDQLIGGITLAFDRDL